MKKNKLDKILKFLKKNYIFIIIAIVVIVLLIILLCKKTTKEVPEEIVNITKEEALNVSETKYLEFLWMVDGAFNYERYNKQEFTVNGKKLDNKLDFSCKYDSDKKVCQSINFEKNFKNVFAKNIKMNIVYGDGVALKWYEKSGDEYQFKNANNCQTVRMSTKHSLKVTNVSENKITCQITFDEEVKDGVYKGNHHYDKEFILVYQDSNWKVSEAYYHDPCYAEYLIK